MNIPHIQTIQVSIQGLTDYGQILQFQQQTKVPRGKVTYMCRMLIDIMKEKLLRELTKQDRIYVNSYLVPTLNESGYWKLIKGEYYESRTSKEVV